MISSRNWALSHSQSDAVLLGALRVLAALASAMILLIAVFLVIEALPALQHIGLARFFTDASWHPSSALYNLTPMLWGSLYVTAGAVLIAAPVGILCAVFCHYYAPPTLARLFLRLLELLAGIPSVVYGFWGLVVLVPLIGGIYPPGASLLAGVVILTIMILPTIALTAHASLAAVPHHYLQSAAALGFSRWGTVHRVVLPAAKTGLIAGVILAMGRAIGETMAVLMVCGNVVQTPASLFDPMRTLTANIALEMAYALNEHRAALFVSGLVLLGVIVLLVSATEALNRDPR